MPEIETWHDVLLACAGAGATLAGLIIVAMSVNIEFILKIPSMPSRAGSTIGSLVLVVVVTISALIPHLTPVVLGIATLVLTAIVAALHVDAAGRMLHLRPSQSVAQTGPKIALSLMQVMPFLIAGVLLVVQSEAGLAWIVIGSLAVFIGAVVNAWVLLVEIRR